ncbi:MAG: hypothetical protein JRI23_21130 [Deltaproteobacteria bacterium]|jgi:hypothetical protein|nr:hypothetical protein [Deltaproteobacteria bacterium]MBW2534438.1 hypothetical protein [Deltaproteobacteria bacterium]
MRMLATIATSAALVASAPAAWAQPEDADEDFGGSASLELDSDDGAGGASDGSDHATHVGSLGLGFMGARFVPAATGGDLPAVVLTDEGDAVVSIEPDEITVPIFGLRYWVGSSLGVELGVGFNVAGGSVSREIANPDPARTRTVEFATPSTTAVAGHLGVPISLYSVGHLNVLLLPEMDLGYSSSSVESVELSTTGEWLDLQLSGFVFGAGARVGAELGWGFLDLPQVTLQVSWGVRVEYRRSRGRIGDASMTIADTRLGTSWYDDPWQLLAGNIGVYYYF